MNRILIITCFACFSSFFSSKASAKTPPPPSVKLQGGLNNGGTIRTPLVEAYLIAPGVELVFNVDLGSLIVDVLNETGDTVFHTTVNATVGSTLPIDTSGWETGEYILLIMDNQGGYLEGKFQIMNQKEI
jgi:hypothetical protein